MTPKPTKAELGQLAERHPEGLNALVAFWIMGWREVVPITPAHGVDQMGRNRVVPNWVAMWGVDAVMHYLILAPERIDADTDLIGSWAAETAAAEPTG